jgi:pimeloyl-ACP methyl ester carboxylesterase
MSFQIAAVRALLRATQTVSTPAAAWLADQIFCSPPASTVPKSVAPLMAAARRASVSVEGRRVVVWHWGEGPAVALLHGWGSRAARLAVHVEPLLARGFAVVAFDAPAHGESEGRLASGIQQARALLEIARTTPLYGAVAHSLGGAGVMLALREGLPLKRVVLISPPADIGIYAEHFAQMFGLRPEVKEAMKARTAERLRFAWKDLDFPALARGFGHVEALLLHDRGDHEVPSEYGERIAANWPGATFVATEGFGHHRIAREPAVVDAAARFVAEGKSAQLSPSMGRSTTPVGTLGAK